MSINLRFLTSGGGIPYEKRFANTLTIGKLKDKLVPIFGIEPHQMKLSVNGHPLDNDSAALENLSLSEIIFVDGPAPDLGEDVEKYVMSEEDYSSRNDSFRKFRQENPNLFSSNKPKQQSLEQLQEQFPLESRCEVGGEVTKRGTIKYVGSIPTTSGMWIGIELDEPLGKNDGATKGRRFFQCEEQYGLFTRPKNVIAGDFPEFEYDLDEI